MPAAPEALPAPAPVATSPAQTPTAAPSAKPLNPMERAFQRMDESAVEADLSAPDPMKTVKPKAKAVPAPEPKKEEAPKPTGEPDPLESDTPVGQKTEKSEQLTPSTPKPGEEDLTDDELKSSKPPEKRGPWALKKYWEKRAAAVEQELAEAKKRVVDEATSKRYADLEKRNAELEEEIRYHNYAKSKEFADNHQKPYEEAWADAAATVSQLNIMLEDGSVRKATPQDLLALANTPLDQMDEAAEKFFGKSAARVIRHVEKIQELSRAQAKALDNARKTSTERAEKFNAQQEAMIREINEVYSRANAEVSSKLEILKPKEGDDEWNSKLTAATKLAEEAFSRNAADPSLTPEQRADIVKKHVAMRNRAIAYSPLMLEVKRLRAQLKERDDKLAAYEKTAPNGGNGDKEKAQTAEPANPMERAYKRMERAAVPMPSMGGPRFY